MKLIKHGETKADKGKNALEKLRMFAEELLKTEDYIRTTDFEQFHYHTIQDIAEVMILLGEEGKAESVLETKCLHCNRWTGKHYEGFWELPKEETCPHCSEVFGEVVSDNSYLVWKNLAKQQ